MDKPAPEMLRATLLAGLLSGTLSSLPYIKVLNVCTCCSMVFLGGLLASWLYSRECFGQGVPFGGREGAVVGLISGAFYGASSGTIGYLIPFVTGEPGVERALRWLGGLEATPPESLEMIDAALEQMAQRSFDLGELVLGFFVQILIGAAFSTAGGLIGGVWFLVPRPPAVPGADRRGGDS